jgi:enoyl-CoA hydratase/carnithine racemase
MEINSQVLKYRSEESIAILTLSRPASYNGFNHDLTMSFTTALEHARDDDQIRAVVINGDGPGFSAGADLMDFGKATPDEVASYIVNYYAKIVDLVISMPKPVIAAIHGSAAGVATAFALACDFRVMAEDANIRYAFINIGLGPDGGAGWLLARTVGYSKALEIAIEGEKIPAKECLRLGLCNKVTPSGEHLSAAITWAHKLSKRPTFGIGITKASLHHAMDHSLLENIKLEAENQAKALRSLDHQEGIVAFLEKRPPRFIGK